MAARVSVDARPRSGGIGLSATAMSWFIIAMQVGMWFGYITFGYISDAIGRKRDLCRRIS